MVLTAKRDRLIFIKEKQHVSCEVRTGLSYIIYNKLCFKRFKQQILTLYVKLILNYTLTIHNYILCINTCHIFICINDAHDMNMRWDLCIAMRYRVAWHIFPWGNICHRLWNLHDKLIHEWNMTLEIRNIKNWMKLILFCVGWIENVPCTNGIETSYPAQ